MSKYFILPEDGIGPGGDIVFRRHLEHSYVLWVGERMFGVVWHMRASWSGVSYADDSEFFKVRTIDGFATRMDAAMWIVKHHGYHMQHERDRMQVERIMLNEIKARENNLRHHIP